MTTRAYWICSFILTTLATVFYFVGLILPMATITTKFLPFVDRVESPEKLWQVTPEDLQAEGQSLEEAASETEETTVAETA